MGREQHVSVATESGTMNFFERKADYSSIRNDVEAIYARLNAVDKRCRLIEANLVVLGTDIGELRGSIAKIHAKLAVDTRESSKQKGLKIDDVLMDMIKKGKAVDMTDVMSSYSHNTPSNQLHGELPTPSPQSEE